MSKTFYRTGAWGKEPIEPVVVDRETEQCVYINGSRQNKRSGYTNYFNTFAEAKDYLVAKRRRECESAERSLEHAKKALAFAEAIVDNTQK